MTKHDLIELGYGKCSAESIIKQAKELMVQKGFPYYNNSRLGLVPVHSVEDILGIHLTIKSFEGEN